MADSYQLDVVIYKSETHWIAQGLQYDITAQAMHPADLPKKFMFAMASEATVAEELGEVPFANTPPAPQSFWKMFRAATVTLVSDDAPSLRVVGKAALVHLAPPKMKMIPELAA